MARKRKKWKTTETVVKTTRRVQIGGLSIGKKAGVGVAALAVAGIAFFLSNSANATPYDLQTVKGPIKKPDPCSPDKIQAGIAQGAQGAAVGSSAGPYGAGIGAGIGLATNPALVNCGLSKINQAKAALCSKADQVVRQLRSKGVSIPSGYNSLSCDQKLVFVAGLGPFGVTMLIAGSAVAGLAHATGAELSRFAGDAGDAVKRVFKGVNLPDLSVKVGDTKVGGGHATVGGHKLYGFNVNRFAVGAEGAEEI